MYTYKGKNVSSIVILWFYCQAWHPLMSRTITVDAIIATHNHQQKWFATYDQSSSVDFSIKKRSSTPTLSINQFKYHVLWSSKGRNNNLTLLWLMVCISSIKFNYISLLTPCTRKSKWPTRLTTVVGCVLAVEELTHALAHIHEAVKSWIEVLSMVLYLAPLNRLLHAATTHTQELEHGRIKN